MIREFEIDGERVTVRAEAAGDGRFRVFAGDGVHEVHARKMADGRLRLVFADGRGVTAVVGAYGESGGTQVRLGHGTTTVLQPFRGRRGAGSDAGGDGAVYSPMTGTMLSVSVAEGERVEAGKTVAVLSAMKMEHKLEAPVSGTVVKVGAAAGDTVDVGALVVQIEPDAEEES
jgi:biotin carboxyl carrier protein